MYLSKLLRPYHIKLSRLAYGVPVGSDLDYADEVTLYRAIEGRRELSQYNIITNMANSLKQCRVTHTGTCFMQ